MLSLRLLGSPQITLNNQTIRQLPAAKSQALLFYLACRGRVQSRLALGGLLWPDKTDAEARMNLRQALYQLRQTLPNVLETSRESIAFGANVLLAVDVLAFETEVRVGLNQDWEKLHAAAERYQGDFLHGFYLDDTPTFEEWLLVERERLRGLALQLFHQLASYHAQRGETGPGILYSGRLLALEPLREESHQQMMRLLAIDGQTSAALGQYERCWQLLRQELNVEPSAETQALAEMIRTGQMNPSRPQTIILPPSQAAIPHNLPPQPTPFVGRERELEALASAFYDKSARLITIVGPGGMGKTRLSLAFAEQCRNHHASTYPDGVFFVPLANFTPIPELPITNQISLAIAQALRLALDNTGSPKSLLLDYLASRHLFLVLDNFEHLLASHLLVAELLQNAPYLRILITSRERLSLYEEQVFMLQGLALPELPGRATEGDEAAASEAVQLFVQAARRVRHQFAPEPKELPALIELCRLLNGLPLALELAAAWVDSLSLGNILAELQNDLSLLSTDLSNVADRHRSLNQVFDYAWQRLTVEEQQMLAALTIFRGGFSWSAAAAVIGQTISPRLLANLVHKSLITLDIVQDRYEIHELLRRFTSAKSGTTTQTVTVWQRHCDYYSQLLQQREADLRGVRQEKVLAELEADLENIRMAWQWAVARRDVNHLTAALTPLFHLYDTLSRFQEGEQLFREAAHRLSWDSAQPSEVMTLVRLQARQGWFTFHLGQQKESLRLIQRSLAYLREHQANDPEIAFCLNYLGAIMRHQGKYQEAHSHLEQAHQLAQAAGDLYGASISLNTLGQTAYLQEDFALARQYCQEALRLKREIGDRRGMIYSLTYLGRIAEAQGDYGEAQRLFNECLRISTSIGDRRGMAIAWQNLGDVAMVLGDDAVAQMTLSKGLTLFRNIGDRLGSSRCLLRLGQWHTQQGEWGAAANQFQEGLEIALAINAEPVLLDGILGVADLWLSMGQPEEAQIILHLIEQSPQKQMVRPRQLAVLRAKLATPPPTLQLPPLDDLDTFIRTWVFARLDQSSHRAPITPPK